MRYSTNIQDNLSRRRDQVLLFSHLGQFSTVAGRAPFTHKPRRHVTMKPLIVALLSMTRALLAFIRAKTIDNKHRRVTSKPDQQRLGGI